MPIYEYQCENCGHTLEKIQKMSDEPLKSCPECAKNTLKKLVSAAAFRLKGDGWYETDFKTGSKKNSLHRSDTAKPQKESDTSSTNKESGPKSGSKPKSEPSKSA